VYQIGIKIPWLEQPMHARIGPQHQLYTTVLPDGKNANLGKFRCLALKDFGKLYGHFVYFTAIWYTYLAVI
jgi:hypothetical protein